MPRAASGAGVGVPGSWVGCRRAESICQWAGREGVARTSLGFHPEAQEEVGAGFREQGGLWVHMCSGCARGAPREDVRDIHVCSPRERCQGHHKGHLGEAGDQEKQAVSKVTGTKRRGDQKAWRLGTALSAHSGFQRSLTIWTFPVVS